jgi:hypothetical protein
MENKIELVKKEDHIEDKFEELKKISAYVIFMDHYPKAILLGFFILTVGLAIYAAGLFGVNPQELCSTLISFLMSFHHKIFQ